MNMFKSKKKVILILSILIVVIAAGAACFLLFSGKPMSEEYVYQTAKPFTDTPDDWITLDGKTTEKEWQDNNWLTYGTDGVTYNITTEFTEKGMYIAGIAEDSFVFLSSDYNMDASSRFKLYIVRGDEEDVRAGSGLYRACRRTLLFINPETAICKSNVQVNVATYVDGNINTTGDPTKYETKGWSFEVFISWEALRMEEKYFSEDGIPDNMRLFVSYLKVDGENENRINVNLAPVNTRADRYQSFWLFGPNGLTGEASTSELLGNAPGGPAATNLLNYSTDEDGDLVVTSEANTTQITWVRADESENFVIEATFTAGVQTGSGECGMGFILYSLPTINEGYNIFVARADALKNSNQLKILSGAETTGLQNIWWPSISEVVDTDYESPYGADSIKLKLVKVGGSMYYFIDDEFYKMEYIDRLKETVNVGLFFNCPASATDVRYEDYSDNVELAMKELDECVYTINVPGSTSKGNVTASASFVPMGGTFDLTVYPESGYVLDALYNNGTLLTRYAVEYEGLTPKGDVNITADFYKLDADTEACKVKLKITDKDGESLSGTKYYITDDAGQIVYSGKENGRGTIVVSLPREGTINTGTREFSFSGNYTITLETNGYLVQKHEISVGTDVTYEKTCVMEKFEYGSVTVNGLQTNDADDTFKYSEEKGLYYSELKDSAGYESAYHTDYIGTDYVANVTITADKPVSGINVPGISISVGGTTVLRFKFSPWDTNQMWVYCGGEVSISGFPHSISSSGGSASFSVARKGENIYVFDSNGQLGFVVNRDGLHVCDGHEFVNSSNLAAVNNAISNFFRTEGLTHAFGLLNHYQKGSGNVYFDVQWTSDSATIAQKLDTIAFSPLTISTDRNIKSVEYAGAYDTENGFVIGTTGYIYLQTTDKDHPVYKVLLTYEDGSTEMFSAARYNSITGTSTFELLLDKKCVQAEYQLAKPYTISGTVEAPNDITVNGTEIVFIDKASGREYTTTCNENGQYVISLFASDYDLVAFKNCYIAYKTDLSIQQAQKLNLTLKKETYYIGSAVVNGKTVNSNFDADAAIVIDSMDGLVTIPANRSSMMAVLGSQVFTGADSFTYTIRVSHDDLPVIDGTDRGATQIGLGFTNGTNWWIFYNMAGHNYGKSVGIGAYSSGYGGGDFIYATNNSPNSIKLGSADQSIDVDLVLTIVKTADELTLYAGEGSSRVEILTATASGYHYYDSNGTVSSTTKEEAHIGRIADFFDANKEFALCLGSMYYTADVTFQIQVS